MSPKHICEGSAQNTPHIYVAC